MPRSSKRSYTPPAAEAPSTVIALLVQKPHHGRKIALPIEREQGRQTSTPLPR
jgi:hypothetical protein